MTPLRGNTNDKEGSYVAKLAYAPDRRYHVVDWDGRPVWESDDLRIAKANQAEFPGSRIVDTEANRA